MPPRKKEFTDPGSAQTDAQKVAPFLLEGQEPAAVPRKKYTKKAPEPMALVTPEQREFWGRQVQSIFTNLAALRGPHWSMPDEMVPAVGEPAALTAKKYLPKITEDRPELLLVGLLLPFLISALRAEYDLYQRRRQARDAARAAGARPAEATPRSERGPLREERVWKDDAGTEFATSPFPMPDR